MNKKGKRRTRHLRVRKKVKGIKDMPRLSVFRSNKNIYAQLIDDSKAQTVAALSTLNMSKGKKGKSTKISKIDQAKEVGETIAKAAFKKKIKKVVFDRGGYKYHGRVKALAEGARKGGLKF